jgi:serine protease Do
MNAWKTAALAGALTAAAGVGAAFAPAASAQDTSALVESLLEARELQPTQLWTSFGGGRLGVAVREVNDEDVKRGRLGSAHGVVVDEVSDESAAQKAGFKAGDIVLEFDGERVRSTQQFARLVQETPAGRATSSVVVRDGQKSTLTVQPRDTWTGVRQDVNRVFSFQSPTRILTTRPPTPPRPAIAPRPPAVFHETFGFRTGTTLGVTLGDMSSQLGEYFGAKEGALVTAVTDNSAAGTAGVKAGDVITAVNGEEVKSPADVRRVTQRVTAGAEFTIDVVRDKKKVTLKGKTEPRVDRRRVIL